METHAEVIKEVNAFFQYKEPGDDELLSKAMVKVSCADGIVTAYGRRFPANGNLAGFFLANVPFLILGPGKLWNDIGPKPLRAQANAEKLLKMGDMPELATLETYLAMEMGLRCAYSNWLREKAVIESKGLTLELRQPDYRRVKLEVKLRHLRQPITVNGERFPYSEAELLRWGERFMNARESLAFRLSMNVRNLLAHGEVEWELMPTLEGLSAASQAVHNLVTKSRKASVKARDSNTKMKR
ncbi:hypothetical protein PQ610_06690 [Tardisphaera miroshnichenkoae]